MRSIKIKYFKSNNIVYIYIYKLKLKPLLITLKIVKVVINNYDFKLKVKIIVDNYNFDRFKKNKAIVTNYSFMM